MAWGLASIRAVEMKIKKGEDIRYQFAELSKQDKEFHEMVLLEEVTCRAGMLSPTSPLLAKKYSSHFNKKKGKAHENFCCNGDNDGTGVDTVLHAKW